MTRKGTTLICRFWCADHKKAHFLVGRGCNDDVNNDPCLELGNYPACGTLKFLDAIGLEIVDA